MLSRLSRMTFWLAALSAALALLAPPHFGTLLTGLAILAGVAAWGFWRAGLSAARRDRAAALPGAPTLDEAALLELALLATRAADAAPGFDAALLEVARVLKNELGLRDVRVLRVVAVTSLGAELGELIEGRAAFCAAPRRVRLDPDTGLGRALLHGEIVVGDEGGAVLPVAAGSRPIAVFELGPPTLPVAPAALRCALALVQFQLQLARHAPPAMPDVECERSAAEPGRARLDDNAALPPRAATAMATPPVPVPPAIVPTEAGRPGAPSAPVEARLDADALAKLAELDPKGENQLVQRVLKTFTTAAVRLMLQLDAADKQGKLADIRYVVHTLKSSSASIGALPLSAICADIETMIRSDLTDELPSRLAALRLQMGSVLAEIDRLLGTSNA